MACGREVTLAQRECLCGEVLKEILPDPVQRTDFGLLLPLLPALSFLLIVSWIVWLDASAFPGTKLLKIGGLTVLLTSVFALLEAERLIDEPAASRYLNFSGPKWFLLLVLFWPVTFPLYLYAQYRDLAPARMRAGWVTAGMFAMAFAVAWFARSTTPDFKAQARVKPGIAASGETSATQQVLVASSPMEALSPTPVLLADLTPDTTTSLPVITPIPDETPVELATSTSLPLVANQQANRATPPVVRVRSGGSGFQEQETEFQNTPVPNARHAVKFLPKGVEK